MKNDCPCHRNGKGCEKRTVGCHSGCQEYAEWSMREAERKTAIRKERESDALWYETHKKNKETTKKKYKKH